MTKEEVFEELLAKRSAADKGSPSDEFGQPVWHEAEGLDVEQLKIGTKSGLAHFTDNS